MPRSCGKDWENPRFTSLCGKYFNNPNPTPPKLTGCYRQSLFPRYTPSEPHHPEVIEFLKKLSEKVKKIWKKAAPAESIQVSAPEKLTEEVKAWLQALGYEVSTPERLDDRIMQMIALLEKGTVTQRVLIRCIGDEIKLADVEALDEVLTRKVPQGWLITDTRISNSAKQRAAADDEAYRLFTLAQFLGQVVWKNYFDSLKQLVTDNKIPQRYVDPSCFRQMVDEQGQETGQEKGRETILFKGLFRDVCSIIAAPDRRHLIFGDRKNTAILWDLDTGKELQRFENEHRQWHQMAISPDGNMLACVDVSNAIILFDISSGNLLNTFHGTDTFFCAAFNEDGSKLIGGDEKGNITIWGAADGGELKKWNSKLDAIYYNIYHSRNRPRFFACGIPISENIFHCWDSETGEVLFSFKNKVTIASAFDNKETRFAVGELFEEINIIDAESGTPIHTIESEGGTRALAFSPDDQFLATGNRMGILRIWDVNESSPNFGKCVKIIDVKSNCNGMKISGARGLEQKMKWPVQGKLYEGTLLEYLIECGAIPDEKQKKQLAELKKRRKI